MNESYLRRLGIGLVVLLVLAPPLPAVASVIPSRAGDATVSRETDLAQVRDALARDDVAKALAGHGLRAEEVQQRLDRLSDEDLRSLAGNLDQIQAAGNVPEYIWILLGIFLALTILFMVF
jgi:hypothetical protein